MKYALKATINTGEYSNLQPEIELEGDNVDQLHEEAMSHIKKVWKKYGIAPLKDVSPDGEKIMSFTGEELLYDDESHTYKDLKGNVLVSGSVYADKVSPTFDRDSILPRAAKSWGVDEDALGNLWDLNGNISTCYGDAIHKAIEAYHLYGEMGAKIAQHKKLEYNYALPNNPYLRDIVVAFVDKFGTDAIAEPLISDVENKMAGQIDRLEVLDEKGKVCRIGDYKTNNELDKKKILRYQHQLSFYAHILMNKGWKVEGLDIYHLNGEWEKISLEVLDLIQ